MPCWIWQCISSDPAATSNLHSGKSILLHCRTQKVGPTPPPSSAARTPTKTSGQAGGMTGRTYWPYSLCFSWGRTGWRGRQGLQTTSAVSPVGSTRWGHRRHRNTLTSAVSTGQDPPWHPRLAPPLSPSGRWRRPQPCWRELGTGVALGHDMVHFELKSKVSAGPDYHGQLSPVCLKESDFSGSDLICRENLKASYPTQGIKHLLYDWF